MDKEVAEAINNACAMTREKIAQEVQERHNDGADFDKNWTNHHGLFRCDCDELIKFIRSNK